VMDGLEATRSMRQKPELVRLPILIASASATSEDESRSLAAGASAFISKPIEREKLLKAISEHLAVAWIHEEVEQEPESRTQGPDELVIPSLEEMDALYRRALTGNMRDIRNRANHLKDMDPRYSSFVQRLQSLVQRYQSQAIVALVERYRAQAAQRDLSAPTRQSK
jgi:CheY-like chemotaxis protein